MEYKKCQQPRGVFAIDDILKFKKYFVDIPEQILEYNSRKEILMSIPTNEAVENRQKHPVLKTFSVSNEVRTSLLSSFNKLSEENINDVAHAIVSINGIFEPSGINELVDMILKKVSTDKNFVCVYAALCANERLAKTNMIPSLLNMCDVLFGKYVKFVNGPKLEIMTESETQQFISENTCLIDSAHKLEKQKVVNLMTFLGKLYELMVLDTKTMENYVYTLSKCIMSVEFCVDALLALLKIIIPHFGKHSLKVCKVCYTELSAYVTKCTSFREKCLIQAFMEKNQLPYEEL